MSKLIIVPALAAAILVAALAGAARPAHATFPGANGRIAFTDFAYGGTANIFTMTPDGSDVRQLTFLTADQGANHEAAWSPDGSRLVFTENNADFSTFRLWLMRAPDGSRIAFSTHCCDPQSTTIDTMNPDGSGIAQLTFPGAENDLAPSYSPQGDQIAFVRGTPDPSTATIMTIPSGGGTATPIHSGAEPSWGPAGS